MADTYTIQFRRGMYADFDTSKIRPGEPVAILGNDPSVPSGKALYIAFAANDVRRLCSIEDISEMVNAGEFVGPQGPKGEKGDKGDPGEKGADGTVAFESLTPEQKESLRGISIESASVDTDGNLTITFSDGDSEDVGNIMGPQGIPGSKGDKGVGIKKITDYYALSSSNTDKAFGQVWLTTPPTMTAEKKYLWHWQRTDYTDGSFYSTEKGVIGVYGEQGPKGDKGDVGPKGDNMSDEQAQQIEQNKTDIASLKTETSSLKEDIAYRDMVNGGKNLIGNEANRLYAVGYLPIGTKLTMSMKDGGLLTGANLLIYDNNKNQVNYWNAFNDNKKRTFATKNDIYYIALSSVDPDRPMQIEIGSNATEFENYVPNVSESMNLAEIECEKLRKLNKESLDIVSAIKTGIAQSLIFSSFGYYKSGSMKQNLGGIGEKISADYYNAGEAGSSSIQSLFGKLQESITYSDTKTLYVLITSSISGGITLHVSCAPNWEPSSNPLVGRISLKKGTNFYKVDLNKQYADEYYTSPKDFSNVLFEFASVSAFENLVFDAYIFDNSNLYVILTSFDLSEYYTKNEIDSLIENSSYNYKIIFWGDSLTAGAGGNGTTYPKVCADELGITSYLNAGVGGETANTIASRNGANNMIIPIGDVNGTYSIGDLKDAYGTNILPLRQGTGGNTVNPILVNGHKCTLSLSQTSSTDANATYTITGYTGEPTKYPIPCKFSGCNLTSDITVIFVGQNGPSFEQRLSIIDSIVSRTNGKYVVLTLSSGTEEQMRTQEATMLSKYGNHLFKTREMLANYGMSMMGMTPTDEDTSAITNGAVPPSLRADRVHLNANGYTALGKMLAAHIRALGYVD